MRAYSGCLVDAIWNRGRYLNKYGDSSCRAFSEILLPRQHQLLNSPCRRPNCPCRACHIRIVSDLADRDTGEHGQKDKLEGIRFHEGSHEARGHDTDDGIEQGRRLRGIDGHGRYVQVPGQGKGPDIAQLGQETDEAPGPALEFIRDIGACQVIQAGVCRGEHGEKEEAG